MNDKRYIQETLFDELGFRMSFAAEKIVFQGQGDLQSLILFENKRFGRMLMLDGATQVTTADEFIYSEMMSHVPILAHGQSEDVLIIGGGDCLIAEEVLKHKAVKRCVQVEIDKAVLDFSKEYFLEWNRPFFEDGRVESVIADGMHYVADRKNHGRFDVIIVDFDRSPRAGRRAVLTRILRGREALPEARRRDGDAKRRAVLPARRARSERSASGAACSPILMPMSPPSRPMSAGI